MKNIKDKLTISSKIRLSNILKIFFELLISIWISIFTFTEIILLWKSILDIAIIKMPMKEIYSIIAIIVLFYFSLQRFRHYKKTEVWSINQQNNTLNGGNPVHITIDLSKVKKVIGGRPKHKWSEIVLFRKKYPTDMRPAPALHDGRLTIQVTENTYLPLDIQHLGNGTEMMAAIVEICKDKFEEDYWFSPEERIALKPWKKNIIITTERNKI